MTTECPVTAATVLAAMCRGEFKPFTESDSQAYAGIEGDGFTAELNDCEVVLDSGPGGIIVNVYHITKVDGDFGPCHIWAFNLQGDNPEYIGEV